MDFVVPCNSLYRSLTVPLFRMSSLLSISGVKRFLYFLYIFRKKCGFFTEAVQVGALRKCVSACHYDVRYMNKNQRMFEEEEFYLKSGCGVT